VEGDDEVMAQQRAALEPLVRDVQFSMYRDYPERRHKNPPPPARPEGSTLLKARINGEQADGD
jgi:hypothetical protein